MKAVRATDCWRRLSKQSNGVTLSEFLFSGISTLAFESFIPAGTFTVVCGANGAGKSTLLEALYLVLKHKYPLPSFGAAGRFGRAALSVKIAFGNKVIECVYRSGENPTPVPPEIEVIWLNPGAISAFLQNSFRSTANFVELLEGAACRQLSPDELDEVSYLVGRKYTEVSVYEVEDFTGFEGADEFSWPYFSVRTDGSNYGSENMGLGEYALFILFWQIRSARKKSVLLLEEIEAHISYRSQIHVLNYLAQQCLEGEHCVVVTTHSPAIIGLVPPQHVRLLYRHDGRMYLKEDAAGVEVSQALGLPSRKKGYLLVEDAAAKFFLLALLYELDRAVAIELEVVVAGSASKIDLLRREFPTTSGVVPIIGVYDAGMMIERYNQPGVNLPGAHSPEIEIAEAITSELDAFARAIGKSTSDLRLLLSTVSGFDPHDWFAELSKRSGLNYETVMRASVIVWLSRSDNRIKAEAFVDELRRFIV